MEPGKPTILIIDPDWINLKLMQKMITLLGYHYVGATCGASALELLQTGCFQLVLCEWHIPEMHVRELVQKIRLGITGDHHRTLPFIAVTADLFGCTRQICHAVGLDDLIYKPFALSDLRHKISQYLPAPTH